MILIKNTQRKIKINTKELEQNTQRILDILKYKDFAVSIWLTTNKTIQKYNKEFRHKDKPTDILSFPYHPNIRPGERIKAKNEDDRNLGDLIISLEYVKRDALNYDNNTEERLRTLLVHGICHLLGYDHIDEEDYEIMHKQENYILKSLGLK